MSGSMHSSSKISLEQSYFYLNKRPVNMTQKLRKVFKDVYTQFNPAMNPLLVLNFDVEDNNYDINVSKDKRQVILTNETEVVDALKIKLNEFFEDLQRVKAYNSDYNISKSTSSGSQNINKFSSNNQT
jgi:DNA mismatch repair ATPase MutL